MGYPSVPKPNLVHLVDEVHFFVERLALIDYSSKMKKAIFLDFKGKIASKS